jgi:mono/diheme cytochrome c family protein
MRYFFVLIASLFCLNALVAKIGEDNISQQNQEPWKAPKSADELKNPLKNKKSSALNGEKIFIQNCVSCHGNKGIGDGPAGASLNPKPSNLTSKEVKAQSDGALFWKITNGRGMMIAWKFSLSEKERWALVDYIRELGEKSK